MANKIRIKRTSPVDEVTTQIEAHPVRDGGTEVVIDQSTFVVLKARYSPSKLVIFTLSPEQKRELITMLENA